MNITHIATHQPTRFLVSELSLPMYVNEDQRRRNREAAATDRRRNRFPRRLAGADDDCVTSIRRHQMCADCLLATKSYRGAGPPVVKWNALTLRRRRRRRPLLRGKRHRFTAVVASSPGGPHRIVVERRRDGRLCGPAAALAVACRIPATRSDGIRAAVAAARHRRRDATPSCCYRRHTAALCR